MTRVGMTGTLTPVTVTARVTRRGRHGAAGVPLAGPGQGVNSSITGMLLSRPLLDSESESNPDSRVTVTGAFVST